MSGAVTEPTLAEAWADLRRRRDALGDALSLYDDVINGWGRWSPPRSLATTLDPSECRRRWESGTPLVEAAHAIRSADVEELVGSAMETLARAVPSLAPSLDHLARQWDAGRAEPRTLLPSRGQVGAGASVEASGLSGEVTALLAVLSLRPALELLFAPVREHLSSDSWRLGICPYCGGPPGFADIVEDGRRRLACHLCGGAWPFGRLQCPFCGSDGAQPVVRLTPEEAREEGYTVSACQECRAYVKELDRRTRWNGGPPLVEDWGSPHFDLVARRQQYWRPDASLILLAGAA
jgi:RNA polymerase subunit RPABC4/transcription elongation factor Spt4